MTIRNKNLIAVQKEYPFIVTRITNKGLDPMIGDWIVSNPDVSIIIIRKEFIYDRLSYALRITYGFKYESDAIIFKMKFL